MGARNVRSTGRLLLALAAAWTVGAAEPPFVVGVNTHFIQHKGVLTANLSLIRQAGVSAIRDSLGLRSMESANGQLAMPAEYDEYVNQAVAQGIEVLAILGGGRPSSAQDLESLARYCEFVARHFKGKVRMYELFNEFDAPSRTTGIRGSPEDYAKILKAVYRRMKTIDPSIIIFGGGMTSQAFHSGWMESLLRTGALENMDAISVHPYRNLHGTFYDRSPESWAESMGQIGALIRKYSGGKEVPLYITEMGWPGQSGIGVPPDIAAAFLTRMFLLARTMPFLRGIWWYDFQDDGWSPLYREHNFGTVRADLTPKPAYFAMADITGLVRHAECLGWVETKDPDIRVLKFRQPDGKDVWALWSTHENDSWQVTLRTSQPAPKPALVQLVGRKANLREWGTRDWVDPDPKCASSQCWGLADAPLVPQQLTVVVREMPWLVEGNLTGVTVTDIQRREFPDYTHPAQPPQ